ncbi:MAG: alanine--tRNA ligase, partial [Candidatus Kapaibacterium sp.]
PGNEGRGYVLRRILRRASRYARNLSFTEPVIYQLVDVLVGSMGDVFPEIKEMQTTVERIIRAEEESFLQTLERGLDRVQVIVEKSLENGVTTVSGDEAFQLYDTFGFPLDLTQLLTRERGMDVDVPGFDERMRQQKERSREARKAAGKDAEFLAAGSELATAGVNSRFEGYETLSTESDIVFVEGPAVALRSTPFYAESGGQQSDNGTLLIGGNTYNVVDVRRSGTAIIHVCDRDVEPLPGDIARADVDAVRRLNIQRNHSVTHLLHEALRRVLGTHVKQSGSLVAPNHLRFDFSHFEKVSAEELRDIEAIVNEKILERVPVRILELPIEEAQKVPNVKMFFGDKYGDFVRVVIMDEGFSAEFCGGTHVTNTSEIGLFAITQESAVASGVRRIEAISGAGVRDYLLRLRAEVETGKGHAETLGDRVRQLEKELRAVQTQSLTTAVPEMIAQSIEVNNIHVVVQRVDVENTDQLKELGDAVRSGLKHRGIGLLATVLDEKVQLVCVVTDDEVTNYPAGKLVGAVARLLGGGGGGKAHMATAGGKDVEKLGEVLSEFPLIVQGWSVS